MIHTCHRGSLRCLNADLFVAAGPVKLHFSCVCACWQIFFSDDCGQRDLGREIRERTLASAHTSHQHGCLWTRSARALWEESDSMTNVWKDEGGVRKEEGGEAGGNTGKALKTERRNTRAVPTYQGGFSFSKCEAWMNNTCRSSGII